MVAIRKRTVIFAAFLPAFLLFGGMVFLLRRRAAPESPLPFRVPGLEILWEPENLVHSTSIIMSVLDPYLFALLWHIEKIGIIAQETAAAEIYFGRDCIELISELEKVGPAPIFFSFLLERTIIANNFDGIISPNFPFERMAPLSPPSLYNNFAVENFCVLKFLFESYKGPQSLVGVKSDIFMDSLELFRKCAEAKAVDVRCFGPVAVWKPSYKAHKEDRADIIGLLEDYYGAESPTTTALSPCNGGRAPSVVYIDLSEFPVGENYLPEELALYGKKFVLKSAIVEDRDTNASYLLARTHPRDGSPWGLPFPERIVVDRTQLGPWLKCDPNPKEGEERVGLLQGPLMPHNFRLLQYVAIT